MAGGGKEGEEANFVHMELVRSRGSKNRRGTGRRELLSASPGQEGGDSGEGTGRASLCDGGAVEEQGKCLKPELCERDTSRPRQALISCQWVEGALGHNGPASDWGHWEQ